MIVALTPDGAVKCAIAELDDVRSIDGALVADAVMEMWPRIVPEARDVIAQRAYILLATGWHDSAMRVPRARRRCPHVDVGAANDEWLASRMNRRRTDK